MGYENLIVFDNPDFDSAIIGISTDGCVVYDYNLVVYDYNLMVEHLSLEDNMSREDAADFIDYNTIRTLPYIGHGAPIIVNLLEDMG